MPPAGPLPPLRAATAAGPTVVQGVRVSRDVFTGEAARFLQRMAQRFPFMHPDK